MKILLALLVWAGLSALSFGALNARDQYECHHRWPDVCDERMVRRDLGDDLLISALPVAGWIAVLFVTGIYADGISFQSTPATHR